MTTETELQDNSFAEGRIRIIGLDQPLGKIYDDLTRINYVTT